MQTPRDEHAPDEISLVDLALLLLEQKWTILFTLLVGIVIAGGYALLRPSEVTYRAVLEPGYVIGASGQRDWLEAPADIVAGLNQAGIPQTLIRMALNESVEAKANQPKQTSLVVLELTGRKVEQARLQTITNEIVASVLSRHEQLLDNWRQQKTDPLRQAELELQKLTDPVQVDLRRKELEKQLTSRISEKSQLEQRLQDVEKRQQLLGEHEAFLRKQIELYEASVKRMEASREVSARQVRDAEKITTVLLVDAEIQRTLAALTDMQAALVIELPQQRLTLQRDIAEQQARLAVLDTDIAAARLRLENDEITLQREEAVLQSRIDALQAASQQAQPSRMMGEPVIGKASVPGMAQMLFLGGMMGGLFGILFAFLRVFVRSVREARQRERAV